MGNIFWILLVLCGGIGVAVQPSINARLAQKTGAIESSFISFAVGALALFVVAMLSGKGSLRGISSANWWELTGGLFGAFFVTVTIVTVPRLGTAAVMAVLVTSQLTAGALIDHFGFLGLRQLPLTPVRIAGMLLLAAGAALIVKR